MPRFEPFAGLRYDFAVLAGLGAGPDDVVAPPYDVIDEAERQALVRRSPYNAVRVELPEPDPGAGFDRYQAAAALLGAWREQGVLAADPRPGFYAYRMGFVDPAGRPGQTTGVIGALEVAPPGSGDVLPHERTMPKPKSDRLDLIRATRTNLSPVWGLSLATGLSALIPDPGSDPASAVTRAVDGEGVSHELWPISDAGAVGALSTAVGSAPVVIADGHHRYETALAYQGERRAAQAGENGGGAGGGDYDLVMALVVELADDQLAVGPIHRLIAGLAPGHDLAAGLARRFVLEEAVLPWGTGPPGRQGPEPGDRASAGLVEHLEWGGAPILVTADGSWWMRATADTMREAEDDLDTSRLSLALGELGQHDLSYHHDPVEILRAVSAGEAQAGVLVRPATVAVIAGAARDRRRMPAKTTFFTPKPRTGMVFRPVLD